MALALGKVFVVKFRTGAYEDTRISSVAAYYDRNDAFAHAKLAGDWLAATIARYPNKSVASLAIVDQEAVSPYHPELYYDTTGESGYFVEELRVLERLPVFRSAGKALPPGRRRLAP